MRALDVFGMRLLVDRRDGRWSLYHAGPDGKHRLAHDLVVPEFVLTDDDLVAYLGDLCHEAATPPHPEVRRLA